jgi:hypothetical protein
MRLYFAGDGAHIDAALLAVDVRYRLASYYHILKGNVDVAALPRYRHLIIDSGLFTFMFGREAGETVFDYEFDRQWMHQYTEWALTCGIPGTTFVEVDAQRLIGSEPTWQLRHEFRALMGPDADLMAVYHLPDENPDRLIDYADYIAVGMPELTKYLDKAERRRVVSYIARKAHAKGKRVHLLGTMEIEFLRDFRFCTSCDTSVWLNSVRYGLLRLPEHPPIHYTGPVAKGDNRYPCLEVSARAVRAMAQKHAGDQR